jgi:MinD superfamily P-loop ATPase
MVCINKYDLNPEQTQAIETLAQKADITVVGRISFDPAFTEAMIQAKTIFEYNHTSQAGKEVRQIWDRVLSLPAFNAPVTQILKHL